MEFKEELRSRIENTEQVIKEFLPKQEGEQALIMEAMNYSVLAGGKRLRPLLISETYRFFGGKDLRMIAPFMAAIEMIHTYSLVHDDLPAMDNDEYRRGKKTTHAVYGEAMGILAGDALLNYAFETACLAFETGGNPALAAKALRILAGKAGIHGMIGGQVIDILSEGKDVDLARIEQIHRLKTSALLEAAMMVGAVLAGAKETEIAKIEQAAGNLGLAFQIQDDILDITGTTEELGKPVHSDEKNHKTTYVTLTGLEQAKKAVEGYSRETIALLHEVDGENEFLEKLISYLMDRRK